MNTMYKTNRTYTNVETNENFDLWSDADTHQTELRNEKTGDIIKPFYICAFTACDVKINGKKILHLPHGTFYHLKEGERITHRKFSGFTKFSKA